MELAGNVAIVTGASRGLGTTIAERLALRGADLALAARSTSDLETVEQSLGRFGHRVISVATDVTKADDLRALVERTESELGPVGILVNNAGIEKYSHFSRYEADEIESIVATNLIAAEQLTRIVLPGMLERKKGHIVNVASMAGKIGVPYNAVYSSTKHGLVGFTWSLREELHDSGVGVSVVCPTFVTDEGMFARWSQGSKPPALTRPVTPEEVADGVVKAIEKNRPEILVTKGLGKIADVIYALSPDMGLAITRRMGVFKFVRRAADYEDFAR